MADYEELVKELREADEKSMCGECGMNLHSGATKKGVLFAEAADAIEELHRENESYANTINEASEILRNRLKSKWISVEERLPEIDEPVMICAFGKSVGEGVYRGHDGFHHVWKMYASSGTYWDDEVTHYMPLPEPPKEEEKTENE